MSEEPPRPLWELTSFQLLPEKAEGVWCGVGITSLPEWHVGGGMGPLRPGPRLGLWAVWSLGSVYIPALAPKTL